MRFLTFLIEKNEEEEEYNRYFNKAFGPEPPKVFSPDQYFTPTFTTDEYKKKEGGSVFQKWDRKIHTPIHIGNNGGYTISSMTSKGASFPMTYYVYKNTKGKLDTEGRPEYGYRQKHDGELRFIPFKMRWNGKEEYRAEEATKLAMENDPEMMSSDTMGYDFPTTGKIKRKRGSFEGSFNSLINAPNTEAVKGILEAYSGDSVNLVTETDLIKKYRKFETLPEVDQEELLNQFRTMFEGLERKKKKHITGTVSKAYSRLKRIISGYFNFDPTNLHSYPHSGKYGKDDEGNPIPVRGQDSETIENLKKFLDSNGGLVSIEPKSGIDLKKDIFDEFKEKLGKLNKGEMKKYDKMSGVVNEFVISISDDELNRFIDEGFRAAEESTNEHSDIPYEKNDLKDLQIDTIDGIKESIISTLMSKYASFHSDSKEADLIRKLKIYPETHYIELGDNKINEFSKIAYTPQKKGRKGFGGAPKQGMEYHSPERHL